MEEEREKISQPQHSEHHFGFHNSLLGGIVLSWQPKPSPAIAKCSPVEEIAPGREALMLSDAEWIIWIKVLMDCTYTGTMYYKVQPCKNPLELKYFQLWVIFISRNIKYNIIRLFKNWMDPWILLQFVLINQEYLIYWDFILNKEEKYFHRLPTSPVLPQ